MFDSRFVIKSTGLELANLSLSEGMYFAFDSFLPSYDPNLETDFDNVVNGSAYSGNEAEYMTGEVFFNDGAWNTSSTYDYALSGTNYDDMYNVLNPNGTGYINNYVISENDNEGVIEPIRDGDTGNVEDRFQSFTNFFKIPIRPFFSSLAWLAT